MSKKKIVEESNQMDPVAFKKAIKLLNEEKGISSDVIYEAIELALTSAYKKNYNSLTNVRVDINRETGDIKVFSYKIVIPDNYIELEKEELEKIKNMEIVEDEEDTEDEAPFFYDEKIHITLSEAKKIDRTIKVGETIETEVTPKDFGRVAAATAKQVVVQKIREAEKTVIIDEFQSKENELVSGIVEMEDVRNYYINLGRTQGILPKSETIPGEVIKMGSTIKTYVTKVEAGSKGALILLSRNHYGFIKRLFELEIPEVNEGIIMIYSVAREAGNRSKVAVYSENDRVDAIGSCIGEKGSRIANILRELNGEKVDLVLYDKNPEKFIANALSPAKNIHVCIANEKDKEALVIADDTNFSLAIGKKGSNIKLASRLTHYKLEIKTEKDAKEMGINFV